MGLLTNAGYPISWDAEENRAAVRYVLEHGIDQFLALYADYREEVNRPFLWGDEVEYQLVVLDHEKKEAKLWLHAHQPLDELNKVEEEAKENGTLEKIEGLWRPEYASYMIEGTPSVPYTYALASIASCELSLVNRRKMLIKRLPANVAPLTLVNFPRMGVFDAKTGTSAPFTDPPCLRDGHASHSLFIPDNCINPHPRFGTLTANIRKRRGKKVCIKIPLFLDEFTRVDPLLNIDANPANKLLQTLAVPESDDDDEDAAPASAPPAKRARTSTDAPKATRDDLTPNVTRTMYYFAQYFTAKEESKAVVDMRHKEAAAQHPSIYMDCMAFGMGCNCLQTTFQAREIDQARHVYDQLAVLCPIMLAVSAASPIHKGLLSEIDVRWMVISQSVDCRRDTEVPKIMKSRYDSISTYISTRPADNYFSSMNDVDLHLDDDVYKRLRDSKIDHRLARHISHLFIRDPLVIYSGRLQQLEDAAESDHFENIQSTNWQSMRFKPPPPKGTGADIGWRVEFRVLECQLSSFENAAYIVFTILLARAIIEFDLDFYIPLSKVDENTARAHAKNAVLTRKFIMQKKIQKLNILKDPASVEYTEMTCDEIMNGCSDFEGLIPIVERYVASTKEHEHDGKPAAEQAQWVASQKRVKAYLELLRRRSSGKLPTTAAWMRNFVLSHPTYRKDSKITSEIAYDLCKLSDDIAAGRAFPEALLPKDLVEAAGDVLR